MVKSKKMVEKQKKEAEVKQRYASLKGTLTERSRRLFAGSEAMAFGYGGVSAVSRATGMTRKVVSRGVKECQAIEDGQGPELPPTRSRRPGGGRKKVTEKYPELLPTLKELVEGTTRGDPESPLLWTARSQRNLVEALKVEGYRISKHTLANLLKELGYSLQGNCEEARRGICTQIEMHFFCPINETVRRQLDYVNSSDFC